jgi:hypothetical protein
MNALKVSYKIGQIIGQPLGGLLAHPSRTMPYFDTPFWREYPYALPCFTSGAFALVFTILAIYTVPEVSILTLTPYFTQV